MYAGKTGKIGQTDRPFFAPVGTYSGRVKPEFQNRLRSNVYLFFKLNNQAIFISRNVVRLHKIFNQHMKTKSALIPGFTAYYVTQLAEQIFNLNDPCCYQAICHRDINGVLSLCNAQDCAKRSSLDQLVSNRDELC
jgi:hypothetical protein